MTPIQVLQEKLEDVRRVHRYIHDALAEAERRLENARKSAVENAEEQHRLMFAIQLLSTEMVKE